ncbi:phosphomethylpyrimidine kinase [Secundilactobacillus oryzae JCM 18671]|uniref:Hydroxymethylpyrimidine/phosphomethylpyrimidine kinase n=1 Tax=Secundilactobacillus oryzae JCM 18671 TaxID=1291743 RepID=A0A081BJW8_9LACO|nr:bifunctional hydroxymethylpyrimidine kinase/phosphomethylpyrimidine kinase [Secundilactobacillus oryzae]GAK48336.1 phosphomethylpyrimidine kinase [Secundilactobacillus oryzae JCM 18671]
MVNDEIQALTIAGNDSDGSAGMPADLHGFFARGVYGMGIITAAVAGNSYGIEAAHVMPADFIKAQFEALAKDFKIRASKTGMLADAEVINVVADNYDKATFGPLVVDPVIITKHGAMLLEQEAYETFKKRLIPLADVITPNFFEAQKLTDEALDSPESIQAAAAKLQALGAKNVMVKGRHDDPNQAEVSDFILLENGDTFWLTEKFVDTERVNGTGDTLSAVIAAEIAKGNSVEQAIRIAKAFVHAAISNEIAVGHKYGPINHWAAMDQVK